MQGGMLPEMQALQGEMQATLGPLPTEEPAQESEAHASTAMAEAASSTEPTLDPVQHIGSQNDPDTVTPASEDAASIASAGISLPDAAPVTETQDDATPSQQNKEPNDESAFPQ
jgi:hypothetical protein